MCLDLEKSSLFSLIPNRLGSQKKYHKTLKFKDLDYNKTCKHFLFAPEKKVGGGDRWYSRYEIKQQKNNQSMIWNEEQKKCFLYAS